MREKHKKFKTQNINDVRYTAQKLAWWGAGWDLVKELNAFEEHYLAWILLLRDETCELLIHTVKSLDRMSIKDYYKWLVLFEKLR